MSMVRISREARNHAGNVLKTHLKYLFGSAWILLLGMLAAAYAPAQINVLTAHNDNARTGQNLNETILTPANVNPTQFGKLFSQYVSNQPIDAQPLYVSQLAIPGNGTHNVVYVSGEGDKIFAFDADSNGGTNANPLWKVSLLTNTAPAGTYGVGYGVLGTPVIDLTSNAIYVVSGDTAGASALYRLHALDLATGAEKFGGPVQIQASVPGTGLNSSGGVLAFDPASVKVRAGLLLLNGVLYIPFGSRGDSGAWHGWLFSYNPTTLQQIDVYCTSPNGGGGGIWMSGAGLAAEVDDPTKPFGRMFIATGNGSYAASLPYDNTMSYSMSVVDLDLTGGKFTVEDEFTPFNQAILDGQDGDLGAGGPVLLPAQTLASGKTLNPVVEIGKSGAIYILDRNNLGGFNATTDQIIQEVQTPIKPGLNWGAGVWGTEAYWNNNIYFGGTNSYDNVTGVDSGGGAGASLTAYSFINGLLSTTPTSQSVEQYIFPGPTPSVSANGTTNGIVWVVNNNANATGGPAILLAYDATNLANTLYSSNTNSARDALAGVALKHTVPTIANGKVYVGTNGGFSVYGQLGGSPTAPTPVISPASRSFTGTQAVTITDMVPGAIIYYTTDGSVPTSSSAIYTNPLIVSTTETVTAIASPANYLQSVPVSATYTLSTAALNPVFSLAAGTYPGVQSVAITDASPGAVIYYTLDGSTPTTASAVYTVPLSLPVSPLETLQAIATAPGMSPSSVVSATYTIQPFYKINFTNGFAVAPGLMQFNGSTDLDDFRLQLTNGGLNQAGSAFYATPVNVQSFTTDFTFQLSNPIGEGITFAIQNVGPGALGSPGAGLGYATIPNSLAIKFDLVDNSGEGPNSTGLFTGGALPTVPAINLTGTGIDLHSGDYMNVHITYDGTNLKLTITDSVTLAAWSQSFPINIPAVVGGNTAYVGFTGGTSTSTSSQKLTYWTYTAGAPVLPNYPTGFDGVGMTMTGGTLLSRTRLRLTDGLANESHSAFFSNPVNVQHFSTRFNFQLTNPVSEGFTFTIQGGSAAALGGGYQGLGYSSIPNSVAVKFDLISNSGEGPNSTGLYTAGATPTVPSIDLSSSGIDLHSGDVFTAQLAYDGVTLTVVITDTVTQVSATETYTINIPSIVGSPAAYVGFTAATGVTAAVQDILSWSYASTYAPPIVPTAPAPPPALPSYPTGFSGTALTLNGGAAYSGNRLRLTDGGTAEARSAFFINPVNIQKFNTSFQFLLTNPLSEGFTFTIQDAGPAALGQGYQWLGYGGFNAITASLAIKFDLKDNQGEGADSTGLYTDGSDPTIPSIDLSSTGINLHSGDIFNAQLNYDGTTLTAIITDTVTQASATQTYTINIPAVVGAPTAYVGFTASTGSAAATQDILNWNYAVGTSN